jgi:hypothetical protein
MEGTMLWFNPLKRHGFIRTDEVAEARAVNVAVVPLFGERGARMRGRR